MNKKCQTENCESPLTTNRAKYCSEHGSGTSAYRRNYYLNNKERYREQGRKSRQANPEKYAAVVAEWRRRNEGHTYLDKTSGYVVYIGYEHPAACPAGVTREHRIVLWDKIGGDDVKCTYCSKILSWTTADRDSKMVVDHVNGDKSDNRPENLVPSCHSCNSKRGNPNRVYVNEGPCEFEECERPGYCARLCKTHYIQKWSGRPLTPIRIFRRTDAETYQKAFNDLLNGERLMPVAKRYGLDYTSLSRAFKSVYGVSLREVRKSGVAK